MTPPDRPALYLTLDQGGHASRALVFDHRGHVVARALRDVRVATPQPDRVEQDPDELADSLRHVILDVHHTLGARITHLAAAALATQRSSIVCWDRHSGEALSPVLSWQDRRAHDWLETFIPQTAAIHRRTGLVLSSHYGVSKLRWCLDHLPRVAQAAREKRLVFGPLASFLVFRLTAERRLLCDPANAQRTLLLNLQRLDWDDSLLQQFGLSRELLPDVVPTRFDYGHLAVGPSLPLAIVNGDQSAALFAFGSPRTDTAYVNLGTGAFVQSVSPQRPEDPAPLLAGIVLEDGSDRVYVTEGTVNGAGAALAWAGHRLGITDLDESLAGWLDAGSEIPLFLNGVSGLGSPFWIADFESRFVGDGKPWQQAVAVAESVVFLIQVNLEALGKCQTPPERIVASGGLASFDGLCQRLADLSGLPLHRPAEHEATARGLAWLLAGLPRHWPPAGAETTFQPHPNTSLQQRYRRWRAAMQEALTGRD